MKWILTDPSTKQYGRKLGNKLFEFKEGEGNDFRRATVNLNNYTSEQILDEISPYYDNLGEIGEEPDFIIAECIFENHNP